MLVINYKNDTPQQRFYGIGVKQNNKSNKIVFMVDQHQSDVNLADYVCNLKVQSKDGEYLDLILLDGEYDSSTDKISFEWLMTRKSTKYRNLELQLEFIDTNEDIVWQTLICEIELSDTIEAGDEQPDDKELSAIKQCEQKVVGFENELAETNEKVSELENEVQEAKEVIITENVDNYVNENGVNKIVRKAQNGGIKQTFLIDKIHHESTLVQAMANTEDYENGDVVSSDDITVNDIFGDNVDTIFGDAFGTDEEGDNFVVNYDQDGTKTYGVKFGNDEGNYGYLALSDCIPNKIIRVIVGKYFEYDEHGNKVFDEHCAIYSDDFFNEQGEIVVETREITEEQQVFELKTDENGGLYFDSDGGELGLGHTRFILYGIECGEPAHDEYKAREIVKKENDVKFLPMFKQTQTLQEVYDYFLEHKSEIGDGMTLSCAIEGDDGRYAHTIIGEFAFFEDETFRYLFNDGSAWYQKDNDSLNNELELTIWEILDGCDDSGSYVFYNNLPKEWYGTQEEYDNLTTKDANTTYYIIED